MTVDLTRPVPENPSSERAGSLGSSVSSERVVRAQPASAGTSQDAVQLDGQLQRLPDLKAKLSSLPEVRRGRIEALQKAVRNGQLNISNERIADALFNQQFGLDIASE